jgi:3-oxoacyl-[acyl-carrier protein] reductase
MDLQLTGKTALVTASTGGIGREIAKSLAREGATVIINGRTESVVEAAIQTIKASVPTASLLPLVADNSSAQGAEETIAAYPELDILVNNLGIYEVNSFFKESDDTWQKLFEVNILSGVRLSRHYLERMIARNTGRIIFIASEAALTPPPDMAAYAGTKAMQLSLSRSLANLTKGTNVTVNTIMPGSTQTEGVAKLVHDLFPDLSVDEAGREFMKRDRPNSLISRLIKPEEIADFVAFICSPRSAAINGAALRADGGLIHHIA